MGASNHFRYYDPDLGRYLSPDPIGLLGGLNEYAYVWCPFEAIDPDGLAKALGGGPFDYDPGKGPLNLHENRTVTDPAGQSTGDQLAKQGIHVQVRIQNKDGTLTDPFDKESPHGKGHKGCP